ncbi:MAG: hypothetical protein KGS61_19025 [Verrucomicrobia bacterium]|nr:hypothetical protein [Verrucomicrobiota bacterium]
MRRALVRLSSTIRLSSLIAGLALLTAGFRAQSATNVVLWDSSTPFVDAVHLDLRTTWRPVPENPFVLETNPLKSASDPGYYGRPYAFHGDAVVENARLTAVCWSTKGQVVLYPKTASAQPNGPLAAPALNPLVVSFAPLEDRSVPLAIDHCEVVRNVGDEVVLEVFFSPQGTPHLSATLALGKDMIVEIKPGPALKGIRVSSPIAQAIAPSFIGDDLLLNAADYPTARTLSLPADDFLLGLLSGENGMLVMTWPKGGQRVRLQLAQPQAGRRQIESVDFDSDGRAVYLAVLSAPGLWHEENLSAAYLEKDTVSNWRRPFAARWKTELAEDSIPTTFTFRAAKGQVWRGVSGSYTYPVWFDGEKTCFHLSKKVPPTGQSIIYFEEGQDTPPSLTTPVDVLRTTLGMDLADAILDPEGRELRTHHRRGAVGVRRACTCGCTEAIQAVFEASREFDQRDYVAGAVDDMLYFVRHHVERINEYLRFAGAMTSYLQAQAAKSPALQTYLAGLERTVAQIPQEFNVQKQNMKSLDYADDLARQTLALTGRQDAANLKAYLDLGEAWRAMGGAQDYVLASCHCITRKLFQEASYGCVELPEAVPVAREIRDRCRQCLRHPDGYEIWPDY